MPLSFPTLYQLKKCVLYPRKVYMRHKENLEPGFMRSALELHYYRPAFYKWIGAVSANRLLLHEVDIDADSIVLDAGAYTGEWAQDILDRYNPTVHAFEPDPRSFKKLAKRAQTNPRLIPYSFGLGDKNETVRMSLEHLGSSMFSGASGKQGVPWADAEIKDIVDVWQALSLDRVHFMKINIEGAEFPLLERMIEAHMLARVDCFMIQFHEWHPGAYAKRRRIREELSKTHRLEWEYYFVWEKWVKF